MTLPMRPLLVAIAGGSASGKTTLAHALVRSLKPLRVRHVQLDHFYRRGRLPRYWSPSQRQRLPDWNHPDGFNWTRLARVLDRLRSPDVVLLEGLMVLHPAWLRRRTDLAVFVDCPASVRLSRRLDRGVSGWTRARHVLFWRECVLPGHRRFIQPSRRHADLTVSSGRPGVLAARVRRLISARRAGTP